MDADVPLVVATILSTSGSRPGTAALVVSDDGDITVSWSSSAQRHTVVVDRTRAGAVDLRSAPQT